MLQSTLQPDQGPLPAGNVDQGGTVTTPAPSTATDPLFRSREPEPRSFLSVLLVALEQWRILLGVPACAAGLAPLASLFFPPTYTVTTSFITETKTNVSAVGLIGLASQFGLGVPAASLSPQFYGDLLQSYVVVHAVLQRNVPNPRAPIGTDSVPLLELLTPRTMGEGRRIEKGAERLRSVTTVAVNARTGMISLRVSMHSPFVAAAVARHYLDALNDFNLETRQSQARERRRFTQARLNEAQDSLTRAEDAVRGFLQRNRKYQNSPSLVFDFERLQRQVTNYQDLYSTLRREYETARLDEVNDTPVITVLDLPTPPSTRSAPNRWIAALGGLVFGKCRKA